jgi:hypothetical protein
MNEKLIDFGYVLKRRQYSFEDWAKDSGIETKQDFLSVRTAMESEREYFFGTELLQFGASLPNARTKTIPPPTYPKKKIKPV